MMPTFATQPDAKAGNAAHRPVLDLLARYVAVLTTAWSMRAELAGPKRLADERAFLPAALALQASPPHPAPRRAAIAICALFVIALVWSVIGRIDIVAVAPGRIVVAERTKVIQPLDTSVVRAIKVSDGDHVQRGQVLIELDATAASADRNNVAEQLATAQAESQRARALLTALDGRRGPGLGEHLSAQTRALIQAEWADIDARIARLDAEIARRQAETATLQAALAKLEDTLPLARQREADIQGLAAQGFVAGHAGQDRTRERIELERDLATQAARIREAHAALAESQHAKTAYLAETRRALNDRLAQAKLKMTQLQSEGAKTAQRERLAQLTAPVAGTVQQLAIHTAGGVVTPAQALMVVVPDSASITAEVVLDNKDIGFVRPGQSAGIKLETFTYTRYGTVPAVVKSVSADAVNDEKKGAVFTVTLELAKHSLDIDGQQIRLAPGMNLTAEIKTGQRRVIEYLLSPLQRRVGESLRER
jgi:hemolysin D